jgi:4a-hydroxytetrahydrobiopterin dehydratase
MGIGSTALTDGMIFEASKEFMMSTVLSDAQIQQALQQLPGWKTNGNTIERVFQFANFVQAMEFVNHMAEAAEAVNHHPDILINYNKVTLTLVSHDSGGVTQRDIKMAARINELAPV